MRPEGHGFVGQAHKGLVLQVLRAKNPQPQWGLRSTPQGAFVAARAPERSAAGSRRVSVRTPEWAACGERRRSGEPKFQPKKMHRPPRWPGPLTALVGRVILPYQTGER
jgi:hypothetical protein